MIFPIELFNIDRTKKIFSVNISRLRAVAEQHGIFEHIEDEDTFGIRVMLKDSIVATFKIFHTVTTDDRCTHILEPTFGTVQHLGGSEEYGMVIYER